MVPEPRNPSYAERKDDGSTFAPEPSTVFSRWRLFVVAALALLMIVASPLMGTSHTLAAHTPAVWADPACPDVPSRPGPEADSSDWNKHVEALRARRTCTALEKPEGARYVEETRALDRAGRADEISDLMRDMMRLPDPVDSLHIGKAMEIAAVATSRDNMKATSSHFFRVGERYLSTRTPAEKGAFYYMWAESRLRVSEYVEAVDRTTTALSVPVDASASTAVRSMAHSLRVWAQFVAGTLEQSVSTDADADLHMARTLAAQAPSPVWTCPSGHPHDATSRSGLALAIRLVQADRWDEALSQLQAARRRASTAGDAWALQASMYVQALVQRHQNQSEVAFETLQSLRELPAHRHDAAVQALATLEQLRIAAEHDEPDRAGEALRVLSAIPNVSPTLFARASTIHSDAFEFSGWSSTKTWSRVLLLTLLLTAITQFGYWVFRTSGHAGKSPADRDGGSSESPASDDPPPAHKDASHGDAYRVPRGLDDPVVNRHATVAFDVQIDLEAGEIEEIIRATPFSGGYPDDTPERPGNDDTPSESDAERSTADSPDGDRLPDETGGEAPHAGDDGDDVDVDDGDRDTGVSGPSVPGEKVLTDNTAHDAPGDGGAGDLPGQIQVPCYGPDGTERDAIDIPARLAGGLLKRKIIALEADGDVLLLYRFETGTNSVVQYDPESGQFSEVRDETFHAFPIARVDRPEE